MEIALIIVFMITGISNPEEFSLLVEGIKDEKEEAEKTATMKRVGATCTTTIMYILRK